MKIAGNVFPLLAAVALTAGMTGAGGCGSSSSGNPAGGSSSSGGDDASNCFYGTGCVGSSSGASGGSSGVIMLGGGDAGPVQAADPCPNNGHTSISGRVYDPAGANPLYNVTVYVPVSTPLPVLPSGIACSCSGLYPMVVASTVTDAGGNFKLVGTSSGSKVPLVVQVGKWRHLYEVNVNKCVDNPQNDKSLRLPKNHMEGDIPQIAISTGEADSLECLPLRMGVDASEFVGGPGTATGGHLHIFTGMGGAGAGASLQGGVAYNPAATLWDSVDDISKYDVVLFSCEGQPTASMNAAGQQTILTYANNGGRLFASHYHDAILDTGPFSSQGTPAIPLATWDVGAGGTALNADNDPIYGKIVQTLPSGKPFPEGVALNSWLGNVGALGSNGELEIHYTRDNAEIGAPNTASQQWVIGDQSAMNPGKYTQYFSFDTPITGGDKCGRVVYSDLHVSGGANNQNDPHTDYPGFNPGIVPDGCDSHALTPQEKALEFMIFDLSSCLIQIGQPPPIGIPQ